MFARLIPIRTQHGVRSEIVLLAYGRWDQPVGETVWIDELTRQTARGFICQTASTTGNYDGKSCSLVGEMENKIRNLPQGNLSCKETWWNENGAAIKPYGRVVFGNLLKFHLLTRAGRSLRRGRQIQFQQKILTTTRPLWQSLMNTFKNETINSCCERNFEFTSNESRRKPWFVGRDCQRKSRREQVSSRFLRAGS